MDLITPLLSPSVLSLPMLALPILAGLMIAVIKRIEKNTDRVEKSNYNVAQAMQHNSAILSLLIAVEPDEVKRQMAEHLMNNMVDNLSNLEKISDETIKDA